MANNKQLLADLYSGKKYIQLKFSASKFYFNLILMGRDKSPDCYITSFSANLYFRTESGCERRKYKTFAHMMKEVNRRAKFVFGKETVIQSVDIIEVTEKETLPMF